MGTEYAPSSALDSEARMPDRRTRRVKDSDEKMEASLRRIEESLGTLPAEAPTGERDGWQLPDTPLQRQD